MQEFPGNSQKAKARSEAPKPPERPKVERITTAQAVQKKPGLGRKFRNAFIVGSARDTADYMVSDIVVPAIRDMLFDAFESGLQRFIYGESSRNRRPTAPSAYSAGPRVNYQSISRPPTTQPASPQMLSRRSRSMQDFQEVIIDSRREAEEVLEQMYECLSRFGEVSVADLYEMTGIKSSHVDHRWGWTSLQGARLDKTRDNRFLLNLPRPGALD